MKYTIKQKIDICLKAETNPQMTQADIANWAKVQYKSSKPPSQTTISRILSCKNELIASKDSDFQLVRRRKQSNTVLRNILSEWVTQAIWEGIPVTNPILQSTANAIWNRLPIDQKDGNGIFSHKWCNEFMKRLNIDIEGDESDLVNGFKSHKLNKLWKLEEKVELKEFLNKLIEKHNYSPRDIFTIDEFQLFYSLPLDQMFDMSSIDKGLKQSSAATEKSLTVMLGCNMDGSEKLVPLIVGKDENIDISKASHNIMRGTASGNYSKQNLMNKITEVFQVLYKSNCNKWITSSMFQQYLISLEHKLASTSPDRKILIILDDVSSHRIANLKFKNIRLCYLRNNATHNNPYNTAYNGVKFDYLPMSFGIIEEFKILFRLQQYVEMTKLLEIKSKRNSLSYDSVEDANNYKTVPSSQGVTVLQEKDYDIPLINAIEWIKRSWDSISVDKIFLAWKKTHLISLTKEWPSKDSEMKSEVSALINKRLAALDSFHPNKCYDMLKDVMGNLNVVLPWDADSILSLVNERGKITFSYVSLEEIIGSFLNDDYNGYNVDREDLTFQNKVPRANSQLLEWNLIQNEENILNSNPNNGILSDNAVVNLNDEQPFGTNTLVSTNPFPINAVNNSPLHENRTQPESQYKGTWPTGQRSFTVNGNSVSSDKSRSPPDVLGSDTSIRDNFVNNLGGKYKGTNNRNDSELWMPERKRKKIDGPSYPNLKDVLGENSSFPALNDALPSNASPPPFLSNEVQNGGLLPKTLFSGISYKSASNPNLHDLRYEGKKLNHHEIMRLISKLIDISTNTNILQLSNNTIIELRSNLRFLESEYVEKRTNDDL